MVDKGKLAYIFASEEEKKGMEEADQERVRNAAPGLLKALEEYVAYFDNYDTDEEFPDFQAMRDRAVGVLVIARAKGVSA